jgi:hypothetical protein
LEVVSEISESDGIPRNSREFRATPELEVVSGISESDGIPRNSREFRATPELEAAPGIPRSSALTQFPEFRTGISYLSRD